MAGSRWMRLCVAMLQMNRIRRRFSSRISATACIFLQRTARGVMAQRKAPQQ